VDKLHSFRRDVREVGGGDVCIPRKRKPPHMPLWNPPILACPDGAP